MAISSWAIVEVRAVDQPKSIGALGLATRTLASPAPTRAGSDLATACQDQCPLCREAAQKQTFRSRDVGKVQLGQAVDAMQLRRLVGGKRSTMWFWL
jgi:hypothetical protein